MMKITTQIEELRAQIQEWRHSQQSIALVPTMGNLHDGHLTLVKQALAIADRVVVSIFVNPLQFGVNEDYYTYPRTLAEDSDKLAQQGVQLLFNPTVTTIYPAGIEATTSVQIPKLSEILCGASRPGFFKGVATVVNILFNLVQPDKALFGEKDYQQLLIIKRLVTDLFLPIEIVSVPTAREPDGLAMSSRNHYLTPAQRAIAPYLFKTLRDMKVKIATGQQELTLLENEAVKNLQQAGFNPDYVSVRCRHDLTLPTLTKDNNLIILAAAWLGPARLIDNIFVTC
jgi:pantoate--beta-alanine ligase